VQTQLSIKRQVKPLRYTAVTFPTVKPVPNYTVWWQRHMCVNNLPKIVTWKCTG